MRPYWHQLLICLTNLHKLWLNILWNSYLLELLLHAAESCANLRNTLIFGARKLIGNGRQNFSVNVQLDRGQLLNPWTDFDKLGLVLKL